MTVLRAGFISLTMVLFAALTAAAAELPSVTHYELDVRFRPADRRFGASAVLSIRNTTDSAFASLPFLLYRLFTVGHVAAVGGTPLTFRQDVVPLGDEPSLQATAVTVDLPAPLRPGDSVTVGMDYGGFMFGYPEVMAYVKDRIDEEFSLLRPDAFAWPVLSMPTMAGSHRASDAKFTYEISATVPKEYRVACGGALTGRSEAADSVTFTFRSKVPTWRIDLAAAKFAVLEDPAARLVVYHLPEDSAGARGVLEASKRAVDFYGREFGMPESYRGYTVIEIPDGWGSQAGDYYFLQAGAAFKDSTRIPEVYHEIGHTWNATPARAVQRCRYFDEAFASFFEALAIREFNGEKAFEEDMEKSRDLFVRWGRHDREVFDTPIAGYGAKELGRHSYTKGAWSLYVLRRLIGGKDFAAIIRAMVAESGGRTIDFGGFRQLCERVSGKNLRKFFQEWIYGIESSRLMADAVPIGDIIKRY